MMTVFKGVPPEMQENLMKMPDTLASGRVFAYDVGRRLALEEVDVSPRDKDGKLHARLIHTITVEDGARRVFDYW